MRNILQASLSILFFASSSLCHARLLQIIHTNDLHSYFTGYHDGTGGYARVRTKIKQLRAEAAAKGLEVLQVDAGDWGEGTSFFLSGNGSDSVRALEMLGVEVATIGNHDHQLGGNSLGKQIRAANVKTKFVVANLVSTPEMELGDTLSPFVDIERAGISIRVIGLTTSEIVFQYSIAPGKIRSPVPIGEVEGIKAKAAGRELVIALTHLGVAQDEALARNSTAIDVIIGGHSHSKLREVHWVKNLNDRPVPIVQAWAHGLAVGALTLNVKEDGSGIEVNEYTMHEVGVPLADDPEMAEFVEKSSRKRNQNFQYSWDEVIGESKVPMTGYVNGRAVNRSSCWAHHMATAARKSVNANVGLHISSFEGVYKPAGTITYADIADNFPHIRKFGDQGWEIVTVYMSGHKLKPFMYWLNRKVPGLTFSGLGYKRVEDMPEKATYRIAFPAEVALAIKTSMPEYRKYLKGLRYTGQYYWPVMVNYVKENSPISCD